MRKLALLLGMALVLSIGCSKKDEKAAGEGGGEGQSAALHSYTVRGMVMSVADDEIVIHHEAIDDFKNANGEIRPMMSMSMPFGVKDSAMTKTVAAKDVVELTFDVDLKRKPASQIQAIKKLPAETKLELSGH